jgi:tetraacyldisaccharide 4'-kinase
VKNNNSLEHYLLSVISGKTKGFKATLIRWLLGCLEIIYYLLLKGRQLLTRPQRLPVPVISVGNIITGGTGKTPTVIWLAQRLQQSGWKPAILTRGYKGKYQQSGLIFTGEDLEVLSPEAVGDEPYLLAEVLAGVPIVVGQDRLRMANKALQERPEISVFILDDGFQYCRLWRDLDIVLIDALNPFSNNHLIPRGLLREPVTALKRAGMIFLTRTEQVDPEQVDLIIRRLQNLNLKAPFLKVEANQCYFRSLSDKQAIIPNGHLMHELVAVLTAIGNPEQFYQTVERTKATIKYFQPFPDHYYWTADDIREIVNSLTDLGLNVLIVTGKDAVKLQQFAAEFVKAGIQCYICELEFTVNDLMADRIINNVMSKGRK